MQKKPTPCFFKRESKLQSKAELKKMREQVEAITNKEQPKKKEEPMAKAKEKKTRKSLSNEQGIRMIKEWDSKTTEEWAKEFGVSYQTISSIAKVIHKKDPSLCVPKKAKRRTKEDFADTLIALMKEEKKIKKDKNNK